MVLGGERLLHPVDRGDLRRTQRGCVQHRQLPDLGPPRRRGGVARGVAQDPRQCLWPGKVEQSPRARVGIVSVGEVGLGAARLEDERQPAAVRQRLEPYVRRQPLCVHRGLPLHAAQSRALGLCLDHADSALVDVKQIVCAAVARLHRDFTARDALGGKQVEVLLVLNGPARALELSVDKHARTRLCREPVRVPLPPIHNVCRLPPERTVRCHTA